jgi:putative hydrolase of the HAD superfamily
LAIANPDSKQPEKVITEFPAITNYDVLLQEIKTHPVSS